jgi:hypothetical protein
LAEKSVHSDKEGDICGGVPVSMERDNIDSTVKNVGEL